MVDPAVGAIDVLTSHIQGHANCVKFVKSFNKPLLLLGGGGYTMRNVSRAWAYETGLATGVELGPGKRYFLYLFPNYSLIDSFRADIPVNEYYEYFGPDYQLDVKASNTEDMNTPAYLERVKNIVMEHLRNVGGPPSVQMTGVCPIHVFLWQQQSLMNGDVQIFHNYPSTPRWTI